ncbi:hypothetical protein GOBAR_AA34657 [Gossypium barbadense]|uniref:ZF-HD dimerization-type domain-containing protein n=1 Tax=Gossypium barbadense TaxID=3634 RepID=A0A2P5W4K5_GOSBA|nr:hypothetical protein GOBAR_AA34657 [Gossypium barbadense]
MASNFFEQKPFKPPFEIIARRTKTLDVKYKECKRNHAPQLGINVVDGCGEFAPKGMSPSSETGHVVDFDCEACGCHRNFHRKEVTKQGILSSNSRGATCRPYIGLKLAERYALSG